MREKYTALVFLILAGLTGLLGSCDMSLDVSGHNFCSPAPDFACVDGYTCRWVSGEPLCLENGAVNPDPLLYAENFDDGVADGFTFRSGTSISWDIVDGNLQLIATGESSQGGWIENQEWGQIAIQLRFKIVASETYPSLRILFAHGIGEATVGTEYSECRLGFNTILSALALGGGYFVGEQYGHSCHVPVTLTHGEWYTLQAEFERDRLVCRLVERNIQVEREFSEDLVFTKTGGTFEILAFQGNYLIDDLVIYSERLPTWPNFSVSCDNP